jgi:hypothetical protein
MIDPGRAPTKPSSFQKNHGNLRWLHLFPFCPVLHMDYSENHHELLIKKKKMSFKIVTNILNENFVWTSSFSRVFNPPGFYQNSAWIVLGSAGDSLDQQGLCRRQPGLCRRHPGTTGEAPAWTVASLGLCLHGPGGILVLVRKYRSAAGVSVTATIISSRIVTDHHSNLPGWPWTVPGA